MIVVEIIKRLPKWFDVYILYQDSKGWPQIASENFESIEQIKSVMHLIAYKEEWRKVYAYIFMRSKEFKDSTCYVRINVDDGEIKNDDFIRG